MDNTIQKQDERNARQFRIIKARKYNTNQKNQNQTKKQHKDITYKKTDRLERTKQLEMSEPCWKRRHVFIRNIYQYTNWNKTTHDIKQKHRT